MDSEELKTFNRIIVPVVVPFSCGAFITFLYAWIAADRIGQHTDMLLFPVGFILLLLPGVVLCYRMWKNYGWFDTTDRLAVQRQIYGLATAACAFGFVDIYFIHWSRMHGNSPYPHSVMLLFNIPLGLGVVFGLFRLRLLWRRQSL
jgi:hypothetical protein